MAKQSSPKPSSSAAKRKPTSEAPGPITKVIEKAVEKLTGTKSQASAQASELVPTEPSMLTVKPAPTHAEIAKRAYERSQGGAEGSELDNWLAAENDLLSH
jgi:hypothetical protein